MKLYPYQKAAIANIKTYISAGERPLCYAPTGAGKTVIAAEVLAQAPPRAQKVFVVHTDQLREQSRARLRPLGVDVVTIQTLLLSPELYRDAEIVCWDECHHLQGQAWREALAIFSPKCAMFGLSATPYSGALEELFTKRLTLARVEMLVREGYITPVAIVHPTDEAVRELQVQDRIDGALAYHRTHRGKQAIHFEPTIALCERAAEQYKSLGINAAVVTGKTPAALRETLIDRFRDNKITVLISPVLLSEGFDAPCAQVLVAGRKFASDVLMQQAVGRIRRRYPGKNEAYVIDCTGSCALRSPTYFNTTDDTLFGALPDAATADRDKAPGTPSVLGQVARRDDAFRWVDLGEGQWVTEGAELIDLIRKGEHADLLEHMREVVERERKSDEAKRERKRETNRKRRQDPAVRESERERHRKRRQDPAVRESERETQRETNRKRMQDPAYREARRERDRKRRQDPAYREAKRERQRQRLQDPAKREAQREANRRSRAKKKALAAAAEKG